MLPHPVRPRGVRGGARRFAYCDGGLPRAGQSVGHQWVDSDRGRSRDPLCVRFRYPAQCVVGRARFRGLHGVFRMDPGRPMAVFAAGRTCVLCVMWRVDGAHRLLPVAAGAPNSPGRPGWARAASGPGISRGAVALSARSVAAAPSGLPGKAGAAPEPPASPPEPPGSRPHRGPLLPDC